MSVPTAADLPRQTGSVVQHFCSSCGTLLANVETAYGSAIRHCSKCSSDVAPAPSQTAVEASVPREVGTAVAAAPQTAQVAPSGASSDAGGDTGDAPDGGSE